MPHDRKGQALEPGDRVTFEAVVEEVWSGEQFCNLQAKLVAEDEEEFWPGGGTSITVNTRYATKEVAEDE